MVSGIGEGRIGWPFPGGGGATGDRLPLFGGLLFHRMAMVEATGEIFKHSGSFLVTTVQGAGGFEAHQDQIGGGVAGFYGVDGVGLAGAGQFGGQGLGMDVGAHSSSSKNSLTVG